MNAYKEYTGKTPGDEEVYGNDYVIPDPYNFEETVIRMLNELEKKAFNLNDFYELLKKIDDELEDNQKSFEDALRKLPNHLKGFLALARPILTTTGRQLVNKDKTDLTSFESNMSSTLIKKGVTVDTVKIDPRKNPITLAKLVLSSNDRFTPLFTIKPKEMRNDPLGKFLIEMRISSPVLNFKGFVTSGVLKDKRGVGFFANYNKSAENEGAYLIAWTNSKNDKLIDIGMIRREPVKALNIYDRVSPTFVHLSPLLCEGVELYNNIGYKDDSILNLGKLKLVDVRGFGDLTHDGYGPIDADVTIDGYTTTVQDYNFNKITPYYPKYYPGNRNGNNVVKTAITPSKRRSKWLNLKVHPTSFYSSVNGGDGDFILRPPFGKSHFDVLNLLRSIFEFQDNMTYTCFGNILINSTVVPVESVKVEYANGRVLFGISPFFIIPDDKKKVENRAPNKNHMKIGQKLAFVVFDTNMNAAYTFENNGFTGDVNGEDGKFYLGYDQIKNNTEKRPVKYDLHFIDVMIELPGCNWNLIERLGKKAFRYSGAYNRNFYFMDKNDADSFPYPGDTREVYNERVESMDDVFNGNPENYLISFADGKYVVQCAEDDDGTVFEYTRSRHE